MHLHIIDIYIIYTQNTRNATDSRKVGSGAGTTAITTYRYIHTRTHNYMHLHNIDILKTLSHAADSRKVGSGAGTGEAPRQRPEATNRGAGETGG